MRPDVQMARERVVAVRARVERVADQEALTDEVEDALCEGYAQALAGDAWLTEGEQRLHELIDDASIESRGTALRALVRENGELQRHVILLRQELELLRREHDRRREGRTSTNLLRSTTPVD